MNPLQFRATDIREIELIRPLWIQLNDHHHERAGIFRNHYEQWSFDDRKAYFEHIALQGTVRVFLAVDPDSCRHIGYCVCSLSQDLFGEIESIFVEEKYRHLGVGRKLITMALAWLDAVGSVRNRVSVADGNEAAFTFYKEFGFYPRMTILEQKQE